MATTTKLKIHDGAIALYMAPGGEVNDELNDVAKATSRYAKIFAPARTNSLRAANKWTRTKVTGPFTGHSTAYNNARHAVWVHEGTSRIYPKRHGYLLVPRRGTLNSTTRGGSAGTNAYKIWTANDKKGPKGFTRRDSVAGQRANPFLKKALGVAMAARNL